ncbi:aminopeptidase P family protein [Rahnella sp. SL6]|uniref:M24 family metallopeptidase n=1 Tax=Rahnella perminowiae TaxID=2816244 RepID=UPI001C269E6A|nr:Xaa-Pro peptidase family protein [Rahnella perminowiae]MBU9809657.1 aminopeptidase P family protein [Rahnella perminowiae]
MSMPVNLAALSRLRDAMRMADAEVMLVDSGELLAWLTGFTVSETLYRACLVPLSGEPWIVLRQLDEAPCRQLSWFRDVVTYSDHQDPWKCVADSLIARGYRDCRLGADTRSYGMTVDTWQQLSEYLPDAVWRPMPGVSDRIRQVKFHYELDSLQQAAFIADTTFLALKEQVKAGWRVRDVASLAAGVFLSEGADTGETGPVVRSAGDSGFLHAQTHEDIIRDGDILHVELIPKVKHYSARLMRPFISGGVSAERQHIARQLIALQDAQIAAMKPGARASDVDAILRNGVLAAGLRAEYGNVTGYALGLYTRTPRPSDFSHCFTPAADWRLEENMVFHMYTSAAGLAFSETVVVRPEGGIRMSRLPREVMEI